MKSYDFNDLLTDAGEAEVKKCIAEAPRWMPDKEAPYYPDRSIPTKRAMALLADAVAEFGDDVLNWYSCGDDPQERLERGELAPATCLKFSAGIGKTQALLDLMRRPEYSSYMFCIFVPDYKLARELKECASDIDLQIIMGREHEREDRTTMCAKADLSRKAADLGQSPMRLLCHQGQPPSRIYCPYYRDCPYQLQFQEKPLARILFHNSLFLNRIAPNNKKIVYIVDEAFWGRSLKKDVIDLQDLEEYRSVPRFSGNGPDSDATEELHSISKALCGVLKKGEMTFAACRAAGITREQLVTAYMHEKRRLPNFDISPDMDEAAQNKKLDDLAQSKTHKFVQFFQNLAEEWARGHDDIRSVSLTRGVDNDEGQGEGRINMHWSEDLKLGNHPLIILDATADRKIVERFVPHLQKFVEIEAKPQNVTITQITDEVCPRTRFLPYGPAKKEDVRRCGNRTRDAQNLFDYESYLSRNRDGSSEVTTLLISYKQLVAKLEAPNGTEVGSYGSIRGQDKWKNVSKLILIGRLQPRTEKLERTAKALFWKSSEQISYIEPDETGRLRLPKERRAYRTSGLTTADVEVEYHPDPLCNAVLWQIREAEILQGIDRARLIHRTADNPCEVLIVTNIVLPITVDKLITWNEILPKPHQIMISRGIFPENNEDRASIYPDLFISGEAARKATVRSIERITDKPLYMTLIGECPELQLVFCKIEGRRKGVRFAYHPTRVQRPFDVIANALGARVKPVYWDFSNAPEPQPDCENVSFSELG